MACTKFNRRTKSGRERLDPGYLDKLGDGYLVNTEEVSLLTGLSIKSINNWFKYPEEGVSPIKIGNRNFWSLGDVRSWIRARQWESRRSARVPSDRP